MKTALSAAAAASILLIGEARRASDVSVGILGGLTPPSLLTSGRSLRSGVQGVLVSNQNAIAKNNDKEFGSVTGVISLPLVSHHGLQQRRRRERRNKMRELGVDGGDTRDLKNNGDSQPEPQQPLAALYQGYGTHYADLWVGTPPQRQTVIVDTGSGQTAFPCSGCKDCGESYHTDSYFIEKDSSTFQQLSCEECFKGSCGTGTTQAGSSKSKICKLSMSYSEGSRWSAYEAVDTVYAGGPHDEPLSPEEGRLAGSFPLAFGCQTIATKLFKTQLADGIMGMVNKGSSYWSQMFNAGVMVEKSFSLCFTRQPTASREGTEAGALTLGGTDERLHISPMVYANNVKASSGYFTVNVKDVYLREGGGESAQIDDDNGGTVHSLGVESSVLNSGGTGHSVIVDSGTTMTYLDKKIGGPFKAKWEKIAGRKYTNDPVSLTTEQLHSLPTVLFQFEVSKDGANDGHHGNDVTGLAGGIDASSPTDVIVAMPASHYMQYDEDSDKYQSGLYLDRHSGSTLGANLMAGHDVLFDVENGRIGWAESDCDYFEVTGIEPPGASERERPDKDHSGIDDNDTDGSDSNDANVEDRSPPLGVASSGDDVVCPTTGCKMSVLLVVSVMVTLFIVYRRRYGGHRRDRRGTEAVPTTEDDLELYEEEERRDGYVDDVSGDIVGPPELESAEAEQHSSSNDNDDQHGMEEQSEFSIT